MADASDILSAIRQIAAERKIAAEEILEAIKEALKAGYRNEYGFEEMDRIKVELDVDNGIIAVFVKKKVVKKVSDSKLEISLADAKKIDKKAKEDDLVLVDITPEGDFGRIAAQTARQIILQKLRESEKEAAINEIKEKIGTIESVVIQRILAEGDILCEINRARAIMPKDERVSTEYYQLGSRVKVLLQSIEEDSRGKYIRVSRASDDFLRELFRLEVPEIDSGTIEIVAVSRDAGLRSKVAVKSSSQGVDPIGSCIGQKGVRINAIMNELKLGRTEEKVDIILYEEEIESFIQNAIQPAEVLNVKLDNKKKLATVSVADDQRSLAIGKNGQNVDLASRLTDWEIEIVSETGEKIDAETLEKEAEEAKEQESSEKVDESEQTDVEITTESENTKVDEAEAK